MADIEMDLGMESTNEGVYMSGAYVTNPANTAIASSPPNRKSMFDRHDLGFAT